MFDVQQLAQGVAEVQRLARRLALDLPADEVPLSEAGRLYDQVDGAIRTLSTVRVLLAPRVAASREWQRRGHRNPAEALAARSGTSLQAAKTAMATAEALAGNEELRQAMADGQLSPDQGSLVAEGARADPAATRALIATAKRTNLQDLRHQVGRVKAAADPDPDATHRRLHRQRRLSRFTDSDGARHLRLHGPVDLVSVVEAELDRCLSHMVRSRATGLPLESRDALAFDAALAMARRSAQADAPTAEGARPTSPAPTTTPPGGPVPSTPTGRTSGTAAATGPAEGTTSGASPPSTAGPPGPEDEVRSPDGSGTARRPARAQQPPPEHLALLRIDIEALWRGHVQGEELCEVTGLGPIPVSAARRLLGNAVVKLIITKGEGVAHVTSLTRGPTQAMRYALLWTSPTCTVEGCTRTVVQHDHRWGAEFAKTGHTRLDELDRLCHGHHTLHTHHGWALVPGAGKRPIVSPSDPRHPGHATATLGDQPCRSPLPIRPSEPGRAPTGPGPPRTAPDRPPNRLTPARPGQART